MSFLKFSFSAILTFLNLGPNFGFRETKDLLDISYEAEGPYLNINMDSVDIARFWSEEVPKRMVALGHPLRAIEAGEPKKKNPYYKKVENVRQEAASKKLVQDEYEEKISRSGAGSEPAPDIKPLITHFWELTKNAPSVKGHFIFLFFWLYRTSEYQMWRGKGR